MQLICVPYHLGRAGEGMARGPDRILAAGLVEALSTEDRRPSVDRVELGEPFQHEIGAEFAVQQRLAERVAHAVRADDFPFVVGGNCNDVLGAVSGLGLGLAGGRGTAGSTALVWFDAHADANTPETTVSGFLGGMPVAVLTGRCWATMAAAVDGFTPIPDEHVLLAGVRSVEDQEQQLLDGSGIRVVGPDGLIDGAAPFRELLTDLAAKVDGVHVHVDLDVIDPADGHANEFAEPGGPPLEDLLTAIRDIPSHLPVTSASLTSYNPTLDHDDRALASALRIATVLAGTSDSPASG